MYSDVEGGAIGCTSGANRKDVGIRDLMRWEAGVPGMLGHTWGPIIAVVAHVLTIA